MLNLEIKANTATNKHKTICLMAHYVLDRTKPFIKGAFLEHYHRNTFPLSIPYQRTYKPEIHAQPLRNDLKR